MHLAYLLLLYSLVHVVSSVAPDIMGAFPKPAKLILR